MNNLLGEGKGDRTNFFCFSFNCFIRGILKTHHSSTAPCTVINLNFFFLYQFSEFFKSCVHNCRSIINSKSWYGVEEMLNVTDVIIQWIFSYQHTHIRNLVGFFPPCREPRLLFLIPITYTSTPSFISKSGCGSRRHTSNARVQR